MATRTQGRITIPTKPAELLELAKKIHDKHIADGVDSPLNAMQDYDWTTEGPKIAPCKQNHDDAEEAARKAEQHYRQRDIDLPAIKDIVRNSAAVLKSIYAKNPKVLGDYGLEVNDSKPSASKPAVI
jgi:hypothetical protein